MGDINYGALILLTICAYWFKKADNKVPFYIIVTVIFVTLYPTLKDLLLHNILFT